MRCSFLTNDNIYIYISNMGNNLTPYSIAVSHENVHFSTPHFEFIERKKNIEKELLKSNGNSADPFDYHVSNCGKNSFEKFKTYKIYSSYD